METVDTNVLLDLVFDHNKERISDFLKSNGVDHRGTKDELRARLLKEIKAGAIDKSQVLALLDDIEGWGKQHVYLYNSSVEERKKWRNSSYAEKVLKDAGLLHTLNRFKPVFFPKKRALTSVEYDEKFFRAKWVETRISNERIESLDRIEGEGRSTVLYKAYQQVISRGIYTFDWNLQNGQAMMLIRQLPSGNNYDKENNKLFDDISGIIDLSQFSQVRINKAIHALENSKEVRVRSIEHSTPRNSKAKFISKDTFSKTYDDPDIKNARKALGDRTVGNIGNFYWRKDVGQFKNDIHTVLYRSSQRIGFFAENTENEVRHVIERIRFFSK